MAAGRVGSKSDSRCSRSLANNKTVACCPKLAIMAPLMQQVVLKDLAARPMMELPRVLHLDYGLRRSIPVGSPIAIGEYRGPASSYQQSVARHDLCLC